jgi:cold shock CspA family protein
LKPTHDPWKHNQAGCNNLQYRLSDYFKKTPLEYNLCRKGPHYGYFERFCAHEMRRITKAPLFLTITFDWFDENDIKIRDSPKIIFPEEIILDHFFGCKGNTVLKYRVLCAVYHCNDNLSAKHDDGWYDTYIKRNSANATRWIFHDGTDIGMSQEIESKNVGDMRTMNDTESLSLVLYEKINAANTEMKDTPEIGVDECLERSKHLFDSIGNLNSFCRIPRKRNDGGTCHGSMTQQKNPNFTRQIPMNNTRLRGFVKVMIARKGIGFIVPDDNSRDIFFHIGNVIGSIKEGDIVEYDMGLGKEGRTKAINVSVCKHR